MASGDERALAELYDRHATLLYSLSAAILGDAADAEEAVADAFAQAWRSAGAFAPERGSAVAWLTTIARTRALDLLRSRRRRARVLEAALSMGDELPVSPAPADDPLDESLHAEIQREVQRELRALPEAQRRVLELAYFGGLSQSEIAAELAQPLGTVKTRTRAGLEKLRQQMTPRDGGSE